MSQEQKKAGGFSNASVSSSSSVPTGQTSVPNAQDAIDKIDGKVKVIHGANDREFEVVGNKVQRVRAALVDAFNIPGDALAFVNGEQVDANYVLQVNDTLEFIKQAGVKG
jgi:hypothetical protein